MRAQIAHLAKVPSHNTTINILSDLMSCNMISNDEQAKLYLYSITKQQRYKIDLFQKVERLQFLKLCRFRASGDRRRS